MASLAKWLSVRLRTKWLWVGVPLQSLNTYISQKTVIAMYNLSHYGVLKYHNVQLGNIEVNGKIFVPPPKVRLSEHNIVNFEHGILDVFKQTDTTQINSSPYAAIR